MAVLALHNLLRMGPSNNAYIPAGFCDYYDPSTQIFIPGSWRKVSAGHDLIDL